MSGKTILVLLLTASLAGNASFLLTVFLGRPQRVGTIEQLALTPEQASTFEGAKKSFQDERRKAHQSMAELRVALANEYQKEVPDRQRLLDAALGMAQVQTAMRPKLVDNLMALHVILTPEQRTTLAELMRASGGGSGACPGNMLYPASSEER